MTEHGAERGFSLIEMMVSMAIGMVLMVAVAQLFYGNRQTAAAQEQAARMQETARFAIQILQREIRMAGMKRTESTGTFSVASPMITGTNATAGAPNGSDEVTVRFWGSDNGAGTAADNGVVDCIGNSVRLNQLVIDRFHIANNASGEPSLFCQNTNPATGVVTDNELVPGVESMQMLVGVDTDADKSPNKYLQWNDVSINLDQVIAVRVSLLLRSDDATVPTTDANIYNHFGTAYAPSNVAPTGDAGAVFNQAAAALDRRMRRLYGTTVTIRNRVN